MANKSLTDLVARTVTADSDLIHVNSGGTDYKETKLDFLQGDFNHVFSNNAILTTQVNSLSIGTYIGKIASYTHQSETGVPANDNFYVYAHVYSAADAYVSIRRTYGDEEYIAIKSGSTWGSWTKVPTRAEITSLNNSLTNNSMTPMSVLSGRGTALDGGYCLVGNMVHINWKFKAGTSATNSPSISSTPPSPKTEAALSCIDITSGISSAIDGSVPCGVSSVGTLYLKEIVNNHIYAITGTYIKL